MTLEMSTLLALLGTALTAVAIFAPRRAIPQAASSSAPSVPFSGLVERWRGAAESHPSEEWANTPPPEAVRELIAVPLNSASPPVPAWPSLVDPRAAGCDAAARWELVDALAAVRAPWAETILVRALDDEPDPDVRNALHAALAA